MVRWLALIFVGLVLTCFFVGLDGFLSSGDSPKTSLQNNVHIVRGHDLQQDQVAELIQEITYNRKTDNLDVCFVMGECLRYCRVPSYEFDSLRWSERANSYFESVIGSESSRYKC